MQTFWETFPDCDAIPEFKALRAKRGDEASSRIMWYIRFVHDPEHEYVSKLPRKDRESLLVDYCNIKKKDLDSALFKSAETWYQSNYMSKAKRAFVMISTKLEQAEEVIRNGNIYAPEDIALWVNATKALKEFKIEYESAEATFNSETKA